MKEREGQKDEGKGRMNGREGKEGRGGGKEGAQEVAREEEGRRK